MNESAAPSSSATRSQIARETEIRRTFAIISHPDAGKTTLTEKLLLYAGCIDEAGAVRGRKNQRAATSDWLELEQQRGISVTSTLLAFPYRGFQINLLDTPGHEDFSEDTYRTLTAADGVVMVLDAVKGVEAQTIKLFKICADRKIPIMTFVNKMDRPGADPLKSLSDIEEVLEIDAIPLNWPIGIGREFCGVYDRTKKQVLKFSPVAHNATRVPVQTATLENADSVLSDELAISLQDEIELLDVAGTEFDEELFQRGEQTPVFFGSALNNFGVEPFLDAFLKMSPQPRPRESDIGPVPTDSEAFSGVVFKIQANLDPRHRDRVAFVRVNAGRFKRDMEVTLARSGEKVRIKRAHRVFGQDRETTEEAFPGDIVGMVNPGQFHLGDTLCEGEILQYMGQWEFPPECFARIRCGDTGRRKQFQKGLTQLIEEGVVRVLTDSRTHANEPVLAAVGELQFDVVEFRLKSEYKTQTTLERLPHSGARWLDTDPDNVDSLNCPSGTRIMYDQMGCPMLLYNSDWELRFFQERNPDAALCESRPMRKRKI